MTRPTRSQKNKPATANKKQVKDAAKADVHISNQTKNVPSLPQSKPLNSNECNMRNSQKTTKPTIYIRIPFLYMSSMSTDEVPNVISTYKLLDELPPGSSRDVRKRKSYVMSYNKETKNAQWVYEILNTMTLQKNCKEHMSLGKNEFKIKSYDQGHLAAAANHKSCQEAYHDTYLLSNMTPQLSLLNKGMWLTLEQYCRDFVKDDRVRNVHVYTGPLYLKKEKRSKKYSCMPNPKNEKDFGGKALPTHFFKVVIVEEKDGKVRKPESCYVMPNEAPQTTDLNVYRMNIGEFQRVSGLTFIEHRPNKNMRDYTKTVTLQGEGGNGEPREVNISVRISS
uniref:Endonuclease n=1 Tax=Sinocyclocheilus grahami TaxID=75366 RepID=A0A672KQR4_SINGR